MQDIKTQLTKDLAETEWEILIPHAKRDALVLVSAQLDLVDVGVAIAGDDVMSVQHWIGEQLIQKPSVEQLASWNSKQDKRFYTLILQPYVLIKEV